MKQIIAVILMPVTAILVLLKNEFETAFVLGEPIASGIINIIENNYKFWAKIFKWESE